MISRGSEWRRWEPHIHAPGTVINNQFKGPNAWEGYLTSLENAMPAIEAIGVTDYYVTDTYEEVLRHHGEGRLPNVKLIFPNIELRLDVATKSGFVNMHLLINPEDPDHLEKVHRLFSQLHFSVSEDHFDCTRAELIRLGKKLCPDITDDHVALAKGAEQFKVPFRGLQQAWKDNAWAKENILIAVAGGTNDGTSGMRQASDQTIRREIERFAHIIFTSSEAQQRFWTGRGSSDEAQIRDRYKNLKPCLHGSDAHRNEDVATPFGDRFSWIKGDPKFDALRQACIDPAGRAYVGSEPPQTFALSQVIASISVHDACWVSPSTIPLNRGLVAVIGARGSGKTALVDMIASGCDAVDRSQWAGADSMNPSDRSQWAGADSMNPSFLSRAHSILRDETVEVNWSAGEPTSRHLDGRDAIDLAHYPRVRYLSQQFVEELCSASGATDELLKEVERIIFEAHPIETREGAIDFEQLREGRVQIHRKAREREAMAIVQMSEQIGDEHEKDRLKAMYGAQIADKTKLISDYTNDLAKLIVQGSEDRIARHSAISEAVEKKRTQNRNLIAQRRAFVLLQAEVNSLRTSGAPEALRQLRARYVSAHMNDQQWQAFLLDYKGPVDANLADYIQWADKEIEKLRGIPPAPNEDVKVPYILDTADLAEVSLAVLEAEMARIEKLIGADQNTRMRYAELTKRITVETSKLEDMKEKLKDAEEASVRIRELNIERDAAYQRIFEALIAEKTALEELYEPLMERLAAATGTVGKLAFSVTRTADAKKWALEAEKNLLDLRRQGPFRGRGSLVDEARAELVAAWEQGSADDVKKAMSDFRKKHQQNLLKHSPVPEDKRDEMRAWLKRFAHWLFSVDHLDINYSISYDGVDIRKLSPGTRGIVLLLLYLALDETDERPLIIDQPEENLDPKSVLDELVGLFMKVKSRRQVVVVTHNANLVINTDADQVIIAEAVPHRQHVLPLITYVAGGLENADIRKNVCDILEGGEHAFRERARRLRVHLDR